MAEWKRLCAAEQAPKPDEVAELELEGVALCVANRAGRFAVLANECPHRGGPLGQGWIEGGAVLCPWHAWAFDLQTGIAEPPEHARVAVFTARLEAGELQVCLDGKPEAKIEASREPAREV